MTDPKGWILYDDSCGFCRKWVPFWQKSLLKRGFEIAPLQSDWVREKFNLDSNELVRDLRLLIADGTKIQGAEVYRYAMRRIWWAWPFYAISILPICRQIFDFCYQMFARHRHRISTACRLPPGD